MPEGFSFSTKRGRVAPARADRRPGKARNRSLRVFGLLQPGTSMDRAGADLAVIGTRLAKEFPDTKQNISPSVRTFNDTFNGGRIRMVFLTLLGAVGFVLLIACAKRRQT